MITLPVWSRKVHIIFIPMERVGTFYTSLINKGWIRNTEDLFSSDEREYNKDYKGSNWQIFSMRHSSHGNVGFTFKHTWRLADRTITDEEHEIEQEKAQGISRISERMLNTENNRIALFTRRINVIHAVDADYDEGVYEDNGESVTRSICWGMAPWEGIE